MDDGEDRVVKRNCFISERHDLMKCTRSSDIVDCAEMRCLSNYLPVLQSPPGLLVSAVLMVEQNMGAEANRRLR